MIWLAIPLWVFSAYAGQRAVPMVSDFWMGVIFSAIFITHLQFEKIRRYFNSRNRRYHECAEGVPNPPWKAFWLDYVFNGLAMLLLTVVGFAGFEWSPIARLALALWLVTDLIIHLDVHRKIGGHGGWETTGPLAAASLYIIVSDWHTITSQPIAASIAMAAGTVVLGGNWLGEWFYARWYRQNRAANELRLRTSAILRH